MDFGRSIDVFGPPSRASQNMVGSLPGRAAVYRRKVADSIAAPVAVPVCGETHGMTATKLTVPKTIVLVGLMGAGKSCVGRRLAATIGLPFVDADREIEEAAGCSIPDLFSRYGEAAFRDGERRVIQRLLQRIPARAGDRRRRLHRSGHAR